jgi:hypothetical protein
MTTRIRHLFGTGELCEGTTKVLEVSYTLQLREQAVPVREGGTRLRVRDFSVTVRSEPDYDLYPYVGRQVVLRLKDGKRIPGVIISFKGVFFAQGPFPEGEF